MRISVNSDDPGYDNFKKMGRGKVFLDGAEVERATTADEEQGFVTHALSDERGRLLVDKSTKTVLLGTLLGVVKIEPIRHQSEVNNDDAADNSAI